MNYNILVVDDSWESRRPLFAENRVRTLSGGGCTLGQLGEGGRPLFIGKQARGRGVSTGARHRIQAIGADHGRKVVGSTVRSSAEKSGRL